MKNCLPNSTYKELYSQKFQQWITTALLKIIAWNCTKHLRFWRQFYSLLKIVHRITYFWDRKPGRRKRRGSFRKYRGLGCRQRKQSGPSRCSKAVSLLFFYSSRVAQNCHCLSSPHTCTLCFLYKMSYKEADILFPRLDYALILHRVSVNWMLNKIDIACMCCCII